MSLRVWWINHSGSCRPEIDGGFLWFPKQPARGKARTETVKNVRRLQAGDAVLSCADGIIGAVGIVLAAARDASRPPELGTGAGMGLLVDTRFVELCDPLRAQDHSVDLAVTAPKAHSPILPTGVPNQHVALAFVPAPMAERISRLLDGQLENALQTISDAVGRTLAADTAQAFIRRRTDIGPARKSQLLQARNGRGTFRANVELNEHACRLTGVLDRRHLLAVHIKPWCQCDDREMLDGCNGLLLSPHVANLFERGYLSFNDAGELLISRELNPAVLESWKLDTSGPAGIFRPEQRRYLEHHRREIFQQHGAGRRQKTNTDLDPTPVEITAEPATVHPAA